MIIYIKLQICADFTVHIQRVHIGFFNTQWDEGSEHFKASKIVKQEHL